MTESISENLATFQRDETLLPELSFLKPHVPDPDYVCQRRAEYPPLIDYVDGVVKGDQAQIDAYIAACQAIKTKYPKPE